MMRNGFGLVGKFFFDPYRPKGTGRILDRLSEGVYLAEYFWVEDTDDGPDIEHVIVWVENMIGTRVYDDKKSLVKAYEAYKASAPKPDGEKP